MIINQLKFNNNNKNKLNVVIHINYLKKKMNF